MSEQINYKNMRVESGYLDDRSDPKWGHPLLRDSWPPMSAGMNFYDESIPLDVRKAARDEQMTAIAQMLGPVDIPWQSFTAPGCPEEPDTPVEVRVSIPEGDYDGLRPIVFGLVAGGMVFVSPSMFAFQYKGYQDALGAIIVCPIFRGCLDAPYPAAINDCHAAYAWTVEHAKELGGDPDNIVLQGGSTGGHLGLALPFRLKRYGFSPKATVVRCPITDDRLTKRSSRVFFGTGEDGGSDWDGVSLHQYASSWMGRDNMASPVVSPEAFANHATVEDCRGLCPVFLAEYEDDPDRDYCIEFVQKLLEANVYVEFHLLGGQSHSSAAAAQMDPNVAILAGESEQITIKALKDAFTYDLRRPWTV